MKISESSHAFYKPLWRRVLIVAFVAAWALYEFVYVRDPLWLTIACGMLAYAAWEFLIRFPSGPASGGENN